MIGKWRSLVLILVMAGIGISVAGLTTYLLYQVGLDQQRDRLVDTARIQGRLIEAIFRHEKKSW